MALTLSHGGWIWWTPMSGLIEVLGQPRFDPWASVQSNLPAKWGCPISYEDTYSFQAGYSGEAIEQQESIPEPVLLARGICCLSGNSIDFLGIPNFSHPCMMTYFPILLTIPRSFPPFSLFLPTCALCKLLWVCLCVGDCPPSP